MKKRTLLITCSFLVFFVFLSVFLIPSNVSRQTKNSNSTMLDQEKTMIHADFVEIPFEESVLESDLVVKVKILGIDSELETDLQSSIPKTIHIAEIMETYNNNLKTGDQIKIMQDGTIDTLVNGMPIFEENDTFIFMLDSATPKEKFPETYFIKKQYLTSEETNQALDLNFGDSNFKDLQTANDPKLNTEMEKISDQSTIDKDSLSIISEEDLTNKIEEVLLNEEN